VLKNWGSIEACRPLRARARSAAEQGVHHPNSVVCYRALTPNGRAAPYAVSTIANQDRPFEADEVTAARRRDDLEAVPPDQNSAGCHKAEQRSEIEKMGEKRQRKRTRVDLRQEVGGGRRRRYPSNENHEITKVDP
jgi:hypothetical protein